MDKKQEIKEFFDNLTDEEFKATLENAGFDVRPGSGRVLYYDDSIIHFSEFTSFNMKDNSYDYSLNGGFESNENVIDVTAC